jgi:hypothetical protein
MTEIAQVETLVGRTDELRALRAAIQGRESKLVWGPKDAGKTALIKKAISELSETERRTCVSWEGAASRRQIVSHFVGRLFELGDPFIRGKVHADGASAVSLGRWLAKQTSLRLRGILFTASKRGEYRFFLDQISPPTHDMARLMKEIMFTCKTPIYLAARDYSQGEIGYAWSLYWNDALRIHVASLHERAAKELLEICIRMFRLDSVHLEGFRANILRVSGLMPGAIVKMCELAADSRYHYGDRIKFKLVHVDYLMQSSPSVLDRAPVSD